MELIFKKLSDNTNVNLIPYLKDFLTKHPNSDLYIGTDSQNQKAIGAMRKTMIPAVNAKKYTTLNFLIIHKFTA